MPWVFLRYIAAAMVSPAVFDALSGPGGSIWSKHVPAVGRALAALRRPLVLVLDDLQAVANQSCLDVLAALLEYVPAGSQIAVASREEPAAPLGRWRAQGWALEIGVADLRLDEQEARLLLEAAGVELDASELSELTARAEGWPAGLYLAALSLQAGAPSSSSAASFTGDDRFVSDYFRLELLSRLPASEAQFLKYTSVLDHMCGGLCDAVLQTTRSARTLETLERTNGFVLPLDRRAWWYRYHHLFAELLRNELERSEPEVVPELNARAMASCIANDLTEAAVVYAHAAGETDTVADLLEGLALPLYFDGRVVRRGRPGPASCTCGIRSVDPRADRAARRCGAVAGSRRRGDLDGPSRGWQRHDRAVDRNSARAHDSRWCRKCACRRESGARSAPTGKLVDPRRAPYARCCARAARRNPS
jgi:LuxR family transcriptional regulator, maltose regulon positive regulatory protein